MDANISFKKSLDNNSIICMTVAPNTFLMPISFVRTSIAKVDKPNNPKQEIIKTILANTLNIFNWFISFLCKF